MLLSVDHLYKSFNLGKVQAVYDISLQLEAGKAYAFLGESGSGKTTLARLIAGLECPDRGEIHLNDELISSDSYHLPAEKRAVGFVFQHYALFPHLTIAKNVEYGISGNPGKRERVDEMLRLVNLEGYGKRYPHEISGGQQQRVALARALAPDPKLILLDEPFSNLDNHLRQKLRTEVFTILQNTGVCSVFITHNSEDAMAISDEVLVLREGKLLQQATPTVLYNQPSSSYVARFFDTLVDLPQALLESFEYHGEKNKIYFLKNHHFRVDGSGDFRANASVVRTLCLGKDYLVEVKVGEYTFELSTPKPPESSEIYIGWRQQDLLIFDPENSR
ncbi:MAG: ABC transporter ATP-binding protein [Bacteroidota bacterium]